MPRTLQKVFGSGGWVVDSEFSVLLWSKALVLDLDQAEQYPKSYHFALKQRYIFFKLTLFYRVPNRKPLGHTLT